MSKKEGKTETRNLTKKSSGFEREVLGAGEIKKGEKEEKLIEYNKKRCEKSGHEKKECSE